MANSGNISNVIMSETKIGSDEMILQNLLSAHGTFVEAYGVLESLYSLGDTPAGGSPMDVPGLNNLSVYLRNQSISLIEIAKRLKTQLERIN